MIRVGTKRVYEAGRQDRAARLSILRREMETAGLDSFLVTHLPNIFYLTGFSGSNAVLLITHSHSVLFTDPRYAIQAEEEVQQVRVRIVRAPLLESAIEVLNRGVKKKVGYEAARMTVTQNAALTRMTKRKLIWEPWDGNLELLRAVKDAGEQSTMREAANIACSAWEETLPLIKTGVMETELAAEVEYRMRKRGASGPAFETIVASGKRSAWPHARPSRKPIGKNELVVFDLGAILRGYSSDMTRTVFVGRASQQIRRWYRAVLESQAAARDRLCQGVEAGEVDAGARRVLNNYGLAAKFVHSTGHGLGLEVHEYPRLGHKDKAVLLAGMVVTIEPGIYDERKGGIRIEDDALVTNSGAEWITHANRELIEIG